MHQGPQMENQQHGVQETSADGLPDPGALELEEEAGGGAEDSTTGRAANSIKKKRSRKKKRATIVAADLCYVAPAYRDTIKVTRALDEVAGRCAVAARDMAEGELVFTEAPVALVLFAHQADYFCHLCGEGPPSLVDDGYPICSQACLATRVAAHRPARSALKIVDDVARAEGVDGDLLKMVLLLITKRYAVKRGEVGAADEVGIKIWQDVERLMDHKEHMPETFLDSMGRALSHLVELLPEEARVPVAEAVRLACVVNVNSHGITSPASHTSAVGFGLFPLLAMLNHSCRPNCAFVFDGGQMKVRVLESVNANQELTVAYVNMLESRDRRRKALLETKHFVCRCLRCEGHDQADQLLGAVCCAQCGGRGILTRDPAGDPAILEDDGAPTAGMGTMSLEDSEGVDVQYRCSMCRRGFAAAEVDAYVSGVEAEKDQVPMLMQARAFEQAKKRLDTLMATHDASQPPPKSSAARAKGAHRLRLHPNHQILMECLPHLVNCCNSAGAYSAAASHLRRMLSVTSSVYPPNFHELAQYYHGLGAALEAQLKTTALPKKTAAAVRAEMRASYQKAASIRRVALGADYAVTLESQRAWEACSRS